MVIDSSASTDQVFRALADPTRRALFERLEAMGEQTVSRLTASSGVSQPAVSKHLGLLREAGLVAGRREGRDVHYSARREGLAPFVDWMVHYGAFWRDRFDALDDLLKRMDQ
jgi:DNA-binding transcriptional ArsR family regulator